MGSSDETNPADLPISRDELVAMVARAHQDAAYGDSAQAGRLLAAQSKLPRLIAENLGAGFGQWDFFPEAADIVDFALAYTPPSTEDDLWTMTRTWASDDAAARQTVMVLVGREILRHELRRIDVPKLRELFDEERPLRALELRAALNLEIPPAAAAKAASTRARGTSTRAGRAAAAPVVKREIPTRMPRPEFRRPEKPPAPPPPRRFHHPKFGDGVLEAQNGEGADAKLTIKFEIGSKTLQARYVTELPSTRG